MGTPFLPNPIRVDYVIYTTNTALALAWQAAHPTDGGVVAASPEHLCAAAGLPSPNYTPTTNPDPSGCWFQYFPDGSYAHPALLDHTADNGTIDPNTYYAMTPTPPYTDYDPVNWYWAGVIMPFYVTPPPTGGTNIIQARRWVCGFELGAMGNGILAQPSANCGPAASRCTDGFGAAYSNGGSNPDISQSTTQPTGTGTLPNGQWERLYIRPWIFPNQGEVAIWSAHGSTEGIDACYLTLNTSGQLVWRNVGNAGTPGTVLGTSSGLTIGTWYKIDLLYKWRVPGTPTDTPGAFGLMINGVVAFSGNVSLGTSSGLSASGGKHQSSKVGSTQTFAVGGLTPTLYRYDLDDWICQDDSVAPGLPSAADAMIGSHIRILNVTGISAAGAWTGDYRGLAGNPPGSASQMQTSTANSRLLLTTDYVNLPQIGLASVVVAVLPSSWPAATVPNVGYRLNGGTLIQNTGTVTGAVSFFSGQAFTIVAGVPRTDVTTIDIAIDKDASGTAMILAGMIGAYETIGVFGPEDVDPTQTEARPPVPRAGLHNAPYPDIGAVTNPTEMMAWAQARCGQYTGNGTGQDVSVGIPFHWIWIRNLSTNGTGYWFSSQYTVHAALSGGSGSGVDVNLPLPFPPSGNTTSFHVSGNAAAANANGTVYQWVAFSDPNSRFVLNGAVSYSSSLASATTPLQDPAFTPTCVFTAQEDMQSAISGFFYKGPGNTSDNANPLTGADVASVLTFGTGTITTKGSGHSKAPQMAFSAWRPVDGTGASGAVDCVTYTGNGLSSRNIPVNLNGTSPLFAFGIAHTLASYFRDPAHTGLDSTQVNAGLNSAAIIGGGTNYVTVGANLNVAGRVYDIFVLAGGNFPGSWTPPLDPGSGTPPIPPPVAPVPTVPTTPPPLPPPVVIPVHGWWQSDAGFRGDVSAIGDTRPANPRSWKDFVGFATGSAAMLGGSPGIAAITRNRMVYAASGYVVGTDAPPINIFDGSYDHRLTTLPPVSGAAAHGVVSVLAANGTVYVATWDGGTDKTTWTGRVFSLDIESATLTQIGSAFPTGHLPYALCFLNSALWCGTNRQDPTASGKVFTIRPGVDADWTADHDLATNSQGGVAALYGFNGSLFVGCTAPAGTFAKILKRAADGTYSAVDTASGGAATANNGYLAFAQFQGSLYASYFNNDAPPVTGVKKSPDGTTWTNALSVSNVPLIVLTVDAGYLFAIGGGMAQAAYLTATQDGTTWLNLTAQLPAESDPRTALPAVGVVVL